MALPSSGVLTLNDIQTEFGGTNPIGLSEYYRGGGLVPDTAINAGIPTSGVISVTDFYGATNTIALNFTTHGTGANGSSISIGTARSTRMVHLSGYTSNGVEVTSVTIGGVTAAILRACAVPAAAQPGGNTWQAWAKVPTGTTATVSVNTACTYYIATFDTINSGAANTDSRQIDPGSATFTFTTANPGVCFWGGNTKSPQLAANSISTSTTSPGGSTNYYAIAAANLSGIAAYNVTSTADSRTFSTQMFTGKIQGFGSCASIFYAN
jgi:hypothetical protein